MSAEARNTAVLAVDLDGTLVCSDLFLESVLTLIRQNPFFVFRLLLWLLSGRAVLKRRIAEHVSVDPSQLPYLGEVLEFVRAARAAGRYTVLATGSCVGRNSFNQAITCGFVLDQTLALTGTYTVTQTDVDAGSITNTGSVASTEVPGPTTDALTTTVPQNDALTIAKTLTGNADNDTRLITITRTS